MAESGQGWQLETENSQERLQHLYTTGEYSDLDIVFPEHETTFKVHRTILSMASPVFGTMLMGPLAPGRELPLPEDSPQIFRKLLDHMYMDRMDLKSVEEALEVYAVAHRYQMESSRKRCRQYILSNLNEKTTLAALEMSLVYEDEAMNKKCKEILGRNADSVMSSENISRLSKETLTDLLKDDTMNFSSEVALFKGLITWGKD
ncbi:BTB/POZ domain-containing protein 6-B-like isoform X2 [Oratosquilla oratoria]|uniref:BTB/POZ domain-containing protein 6-B-like isoform X2 n=1 Tax=Oratosquilla oratoria TaxID=337810 RepID=UPI003F76079A